MCTDEKANAQQSPEQMHEPQGHAEAPEGVPENHEEKKYAFQSESAYQPMYGTPQGQPYMQMPQQPMYQQAPQPESAYQPMYGTPQGQPYMQMPQQPMYQQAPQPESAYQPMYGEPQGQPYMQMPQQPMYQQAPQPESAYQPMYGEPQGQPYMQMPQQPMYQQAPQPEPAYQPMYGAPQQPYGQPQMGPQGGQSGCSHHAPEDPFGGMFNMFGEMVNNNPNLSSLNKMVSVTNSDFLKGALLGAGLTLLLTSDGVKDMLSGLLAGTMNMFGDEKETGEEDE